MAGASARLALFSGVAIGVAIAIGLDIYATYYLADLVYRYNMMKTQRAIEEQERRRDQIA